MTIWTLIGFVSLIYLLFRLYSWVRSVNEYHNFTTNLLKLIYRNNREETRKTIIDYLVLLRSIQGTDHNAVVEAIGKTWKAPLEKDGGGYFKTELVFKHLLGYFDREMKGATIQEIDGLLNSNYDERIKWHKKFHSTLKEEDWHDDSITKEELAQIRKKFGRALDKAYEQGKDDKA